MSIAMSKPTVSLLDVSSYLPGDPVPAEYYAQFADSDDLRDSLMFRAPKFRHHVAPDETATDMIERAAAGLIERHGEEIVVGADVLITAVARLHTDSGCAPTWCSIFTTAAARHLCSVCRSPANCCPPARDTPH